MDINVFAASAAVLLVLIFGWMSYKYEVKQKIPDISQFPFNEATGKERSFVNKTGDSSLWTEGARRKAIAKAYKPSWCCGVTKVIKETQHTTGSTSGVVEAYFLSAFGRFSTDVCTDIVYDGSGDGGCILDGNVDNGCADQCTEIVYDGNVDNGCAEQCEEVVYDGNIQEDSLEANATTFCEDK